MLWARRLVGLTRIRVHGMCVMMVGKGEGESAIWRPWKPIIRRKLMNFYRIEVLAMLLENFPPQNIQAVVHDIDVGSLAHAPCAHFDSSQFSMLCHESVGTIWNVDWHSMHTHTHLMINLIGFCIFRVFSLSRCDSTLTANCDGAKNSNAVMARDLSNPLIITGLELKVSACVRIFLLLLSCLNDLRASKGDGVQPCGDTRHSARNERSEPKEKRF